MSTEETEYLGLHTGMINASVQEKTTQVVFETKKAFFDLPPIIQVIVFIFLVVVIFYYLLPGLIIFLSLVSRYLLAETLSLAILVIAVIMLWVMWINKL